MNAAVPRIPSGISASATVSDLARVGRGTTVWDLAQVREHARIGGNCTIGRNTYIDHHVVIGDNCKIQNNALIYWPARIHDGVFIGPAVILTNDRHPRAVGADLRAKDADAWDPDGVTVETGASIGAGAVIGPGIRIGRWALVGAGSVVTRDVGPHEIVAGNPANRIGWAGKSGKRLDDDLVDADTGDRYQISGGELVLE